MSQQEPCFLCNGKGYIEDALGVRRCVRCDGEGVMTERALAIAADEQRVNEKLDRQRGK